MSETSRRKFLATTGAGVAAGAVAVTSTAQAAEAAGAQPSKDSARESVVVYVKDHRLAEVRLLVGEREVVVQDRDLVTRILNAAGGK